MITLMTGAWCDKKVVYDSFKNFCMSEIGKDIEVFINSYIDSHRQDLDEPFKWTDDVIGKVENYVNENIDKAFPNPDGAVDGFRFVNLCLDAFDDLDLLGVRLL